MRQRSSCHSRPSAHTVRVLHERAAGMRHAPTTSEARLFEALRGGALGVSFRRQVPLLGRFIVDLLAAEVALVVEVDGGYHEGRGAADARRDRALLCAGYRVVRLHHTVVMHDLPAALAQVQASIEQLRRSGV